MTTLSSYASMRNTARFAGVLYFLLAAIAIYVFAYVHPLIMVRNNAAATTDNMIAHEFLYRTGLMANVVTDMLFLIIVLVLYRLLKDINVNQARVMVGLVVISLPIALITDILEITALNMLKGNFLTSFQPEQIQQMAFTLVKISSNSGQMLTLLWGLWLFPLGSLVYKSGFIPKIFGILLIINGAGYVINNITFMLFPELQPTVLRFIFPTYFAGELPFIFWLLIKGVKNQ